MFTPSHRAPWLLAGLGHRAIGTLIPSLAAVGVSLGHVYDQDPAKAGDFTRLQHAGLLPPHCVFSTEPPRNTTDFSVAVIATPHDSHAALTQRFIDDGCVVLKEKPLASTLEEATELVRGCGDRMCVLVERPHLRSFRQAKRLLAQIGTPQTYAVRHWRRAQPYAPTWRNNARRAGGGALIDLGYHAVDFVTRIWGAPVGTHAQVPTRARPGYEVEEAVRLTLTHQDGTRGVVDISRVGAADVERYEVAGPLGSVAFTKFAVELHVGRTRPRVWTYEEGSSDHAVRALNGALRLLSDPETAQVENRHALRVMKVISESYRLLGKPDTRELS